MAQHHILVLPSRQDGFGMVLLEALATGLPVVASTMTGGPDIQNAISDRRWVEIVLPGDVDDLIRGIEAMAERENQRPLSTTATRRRLSRQDMAHFSWQGYGNRYAQFLESIYTERLER